MTNENNSLYRVLKKIFVTILLLFLCSIPVFYLIVSLSTMDRDLSNIYITARVLRFLVVVVIGCVIRKRNQEIFAVNVLLRKKFMYVVFGCICVSTWLHYDNTTPKLYLTVAHTIGVFDLETTPLFLSVLWEQLFAGDLYWSILLCLLIVFCTCKKPVKCKCREYCIKQNEKD